MKNVCQTCVFDLEYGLPVAVRDHALGLKDDIPTGDFNKEHFHQNLGKELQLQGDDLRGAHSAPNQFLERISQGRRGPYYKRNLPHICSFWVKVCILRLKTFKINKEFRVNVEEVRNVRIATRSRPIPMIPCLSKILLIVFTVRRILWQISYSNEQLSYQALRHQMINQLPLSGLEELPVLSGNVENYT